LIDIHSFLSEACCALGCAIAGLATLSTWFAHSTIKIHSIYTWGALVKISTSFARLIAVLAFSTRDEHPWVQAWKTLSSRLALATFRSTGFANAASNEHQLRSAEATFSFALALGAVLSTELASTTSDVHSSGTALLAGVGVGAVNAVLFAFLAHASLDVHSNGLRALQAGTFVGTRAAVRAARGADPTFQEVAAETLCAAVWRAFRAGSWARNTFISFLVGVSAVTS
jgi:hypothetical protein